MKKLFSMALMFLLMFTLSACNEEANEPAQDNPNTEDVFWEVTIEIGEESKTHSLPEDYDGSVFDLLDLEYDLRYSESEFGVFMMGLEDLQPKNGAYIAVEENGGMAQVGIDQLTIEDGDVFSFEVVWYDELLQSVDQLIHLFLENHVDMYVNNEFLDVNVVSALVMLGLEEDYLADIEVSSMAMFDLESLETTAGYFKAVTMLSLLGEDVSTYVDEYASVASTGPYGETAYGLMVINHSASEYSNLVSTFEEDLKVNTPYTLGLDAGGVTLLALSIQDFPEKQGLIDGFVSWIQESQLPSGGLKTRDITWGETTYPGSENAASMAQVIIGLLANGLDPSGEDFLVSDVSLMDRFLEFSTEDGAFDYVLDDDLENDLMFSTPQAFLAIVMFQEFKATNSGVHPYIID
jgi:hypothetical protein